MRGPVSLTMNPRARARRRPPRRPVGVEVEPDQQARAADLGDPRVGGEPVAQPLAERPSTWSSSPSASMVSSTARAAAQRDRVAAERGAVVAGLEQLAGRARAPMAGADRDAAAQALGERDDVGHDVQRSGGWWANQRPVRPMPVWTSSSQSSAPCSVGDPAGGGEVAVGRDDDAGLALDRLEHDGGGLVGDGGRESGGVAVRDEGDVAGQRLERLAVGRLAGQRERAHGAAVEASPSAATRWVRPVRRVSLKAASLASVPELVKNDPARRLVRAAPSSRSASSTCGSWRRSSRRGRASAAGRSPPRPAPGGRGRAR